MTGNWISFQNKLPPGGVPYCLFWAVKDQKPEVGQREGEHRILTAGGMHFISDGYFSHWRLPLAPPNQE